MANVIPIGEQLMTTGQLHRNWRKENFGADHGLARGFTLIELMIVIAIITILMGIGVGMYQQSIQRARETVLKQDLQTMRVAIDNYTLDKEAAPQSLEDLQQSGYLRSIPIDPITRQADWQTKFGDTVLSPDQTTTGIEDVHSNSDRTALDGTAYNTW
ncbi:MAG TPA: prepilin-type N-terminal cleavage/methylation domain-containing protein [Candidatus Acidoferrales bacterium]|nr:prepilin-type N-terminal cleavage/methylation domain-containing protein [Candidatus Acidoferrales bacterium]